MEYGGRFAVRTCARVGGGANQNYKVEEGNWVNSGQIGGFTPLDEMRAMGRFIREQLNGGPLAKSYIDTNLSWSINSWEISEPSNSYQIAYIRLLSEFALPPNGDDKPDEPDVTGNIIYVATNGNDTTGNGSSDRPYRSIRHAASVATPSTTILVRTGTYREHSIRPRSGTADGMIVFRLASTTGEVIIEHESNTGLY